MRASISPASGRRRAKRSNPVRVRLADEATWTHDGKMDFVDNALNERSGTMRGRAIFDNKDGLLTPGVFARLHCSAARSMRSWCPTPRSFPIRRSKIVFTVDADNVVTASR